MELNDYASGIREVNTSELLRHPSGIEDEGELSFVSMEFYMKYNLDTTNNTNETWVRLLAFQQGWKASKEYYKIND